MDYMSILKQAIGKWNKNFYNNFKNIYLELNLTKEVYNLFDKNYKTLLRVIKVELRKWSDTMFID